MTEDEAKTKICPKTFGIPDVRDGDGCGIQQGGPHNCVASACMAWRWIDTHVTNPENPTGNLIRSTRTYGACGLAGPWFQNYRPNPSEVFDRTVA